MVESRFHTCKLIQVRRQTLVRTFEFAPDEASKLHYEQSFPIPVRPPAPTVDHRATGEAAQPHKIENSTIVCKQNRKNGVWSIYVIGTALSSLIAGQVGVFVTSALFTPPFGQQHCHPQNRFTSLRRCQKRLAFQVSLASGAHQSYEVPGIPGATLLSSAPYTLASVQLFFHLAHNNFANIFCR